MSTLIFFPPLFEVHMNFWGPGEGLCGKVTTLGGHETGMDMGGYLHPHTLH